MTTLPLQRQGAPVGLPEPLPMGLGGGDPQPAAPPAGHTSAPSFQSPTHFCPPPSENCCWTWVGGGHLFWHSKPFSSRPEPLLTNLAWVCVGLQGERNKLDEGFDLSGTLWFNFFSFFSFFFFFLSGEEGETRWTMRDLILVLKFPSSYVTS